jgi:macrolide transport system ATP-binding/permease protein
MTMLQVTNLTKDLGGHPILTGVTFHLAPNERLALVGANGAGKSTLLHCLAGRLQPDGGGIHWVHPGLQTAFLPQDPAFDPVRPLGEQIPTADPALLSHLHLTDLLERPAGALSGGEKTRAALCQALAGRPALLLLDEPTNHLDMAGIDWLIAVLKGWQGALLVVSHDRYFLDQVTTRTLEMADGKVTSYPGNWSAYRDQKAAERAKAEADYRNYLVKKVQLEEAIRRQRQWAEKGHRSKPDRTEAKFQKGYNENQSLAHMRIAKSMAKKLAWMKVEKPREVARVNVIFGGEGETARHLVLAQEMGFGYPGAPAALFTDASFWIERGERVAIVGPNGSGKTTLVKLLLGELEPTAGKLYRAPARVGYLHQELADLNPTRTVLAEAQSESRAPASEVRNLLACLLFRGEAITKRVGDLSGGERLRLALAKLILAEPDLLVLDEPTNGLDLLTRERVEEALLAYGGTLVLVSHDRYLLERLGEAVLAVQDQRVTMVREPFRAWAERSALAHRRSAGEAQGAGLSGRASGPALTKRQRQEAILLLETRLAYLGARLAAPAQTEKEALDAEFLRLSRELRQLRG